jgi:glycine hydroxymethyltransferase
LRLGTPAITTRGMGLDEAAAIAGLVADLIDAPESPAVETRVRDAVEALGREFPVYT